MENFENYITVEDHGRTFYKCGLCRNDFHTQQQMDRHLVGIHKVKTKSVLADPKESRLPNSVAVAGTSPQNAGLGGIFGAEGKETPSHHKRVRSEVKPAVDADDLEADHSFEDEPKEPLNPVESTQDVAKNAPTVSEE